jgi:hypothetical protein
MESDVRRLFRSLGLPDRRYHEAVAETAAGAAAARWPLLAAVDRLLAASDARRRRRGEGDPR